MFFTLVLVAGFTLEIVNFAFTLVGGSSPLILISAVFLPQGCYLGKILPKATGPSVLMFCARQWCLFFFFLNVPICA